MIKVGIGYDCSGEALALELKEHLKDIYTSTSEHLDFIVRGPWVPNSDEKFVMFGSKIGRALTKREIDFGIVISEFGSDICMAANRWVYCRAALCHDTDTASYSRKLFNANTLALSARTTDYDSAIQIADVFFNTEYDKNLENDILVSQLTIIR